MKKGCKTLESITNRNNQQASMVSGFGTEKISKMQLIVFTVFFLPEKAHKARKVEAFIID